MWRLTAALVAITLIVLTAYNLGGRLLPASAGALAVFDVNAVLDDSDADLANPACETASGDCTLRAAVEQANFETMTGCTPCTITFDPGVFPPGGPVILSLDSELPDIIVPLTIDGTGAGVILEPAAGIPVFCGFCILDDTPANPTDFTINGGGTFTIREFPVGVLIAGDDGGGFGFGPVHGVNLSGLDIDGSGFAGIGIFSQDGVTNVNVNDTNVSFSGDGIVIDNLSGPTDGITFDNVTVDHSAQRGIALPGQSISNVTFNNVDIDSSGQSGISIGGEGVTNVDLSNSTISNNGFGDFGDFPGFEIIAPDGPVQGITFGSLDIDANAGSGILIEGESVFDINGFEVSITNNGGDGFHILAVSAEGYIFEFGNIDSNGGSGINIEGESIVDTIFDGVRTFNNGGDGIIIFADVDMVGMVLNNLDLDSNGGAGVNFRSPFFVDIDFTSGTISSNGDSGVDISGSGGANGLTFNNLDISDNGGAGIDIFFFGTEDNPPVLFFDVIHNTFTDNVGPAVNITDASGVTVRNNVMSGNSAGVVVQEIDGVAGDITISQNSMKGNFGLGIDLGGDGVTPNDPGDADTGPNGRVNFPVILDIDIASRTVHGEACEFCTVELFLTEDPADPSGFGEGFIFADGFESGDTTAWAESYSRAGSTFAGPTGAFGVTISAFPCGLPAGSLTATATDANGSTSEFSANVAGFPGTEPCPPDKDGDGCTDAQELGLDERLGGRRDPNNFWDFFDPNRDAAVSLLDFLAVLRHFGAVRVPPLTKAEALAEVLLPEPPAGEYWALADRGGQAPGGDPWDELPPDGSIGLLDFLSLLRQFGHSCA